jgi:hypothetical protein
MEVCISESVEYGVLGSAGINLRRTPTGQYF